MTTKCKFFLSPLHCVVNSKPPSSSSMKHEPSEGFWQKNSGIIILNRYMKKKARIVSIRIICSPQKIVDIPSESLCSNNHMSDWLLQAEWYDYSVTPVNFFLVLITWLFFTGSSENSFLPPSTADCWKLFFRWDEKSRPTMNLLLNNTRYVWHFPNWENNANVFPVILYRKKPTMRFFSLYSMGTSKNFERQARASKTHSQRGSQSGHESTSTQNSSLLQ